RIGGMRGLARLRQEAIMTDTRAIDETAARWHAREMIGGLTPDDAQRLDAWLAQDVRHRLAYADVAAASYALEQAAPNVAHAGIEHASKESGVRRWPLWIGAAAAPLVLLIAVLWMPHAVQDWRSDVHTAIGVV